ncbi:B12-binding domain-containing radical SAM protein [Amycolatopsis sp. NPDC059021]|uniref:B12-binding domain-containing radical SAM protein n=1 Tax=Amycolatopsis sp. NPDC059021 TaxID=3346704 RepID=UPI00366A5E64
MHTLHDTGTAVTTLARPTTSTMTDAMSPFHHRLIEAIRATTPDGDVPASTVAAVKTLPETDLTALSEHVANVVPGRFSLTGALDRRLLVAERAGHPGSWVAADLSGQPHATRAWPEWTSGRMSIAEPQSWLSHAELSEEAADRLARPRVLLASLYHPEWFPLPRFPLAISDLARAARLTLLGQVHLVDMQLGASLQDILRWIDQRRPDIVGISATFGQHDLMRELLDQLQEVAPPLVLAGGSLTVRNEAMLLQRYPRLLIARGAGEPTIADTLAYFHRDRALTDIRGIGYRGAPCRGALAFGRRARRTAVTPNRLQRDFLPELDLLDATFAAKGVAQLEISRGCTSHCSFCPRGHKGSWAGGSTDRLPWMLSEIGTVADRHPGISRTVYVVDEEFIGRGADAVPRARAIARTISDAGFAWESSCRIDQVVRPDRDRDWHAERARMWRDLLEAGLRRMLFGVESGVTSILRRFAKDTTAEQNALAIRTLSALGVPTRFTYITFDHLMTADELAATHAFQARTDLLLRPLPELPVEQIVDGVTDPDFVARHATGRPFYTEISYMLVSMECLIGAPYTRAVQARGLAGQPDPTMGRVEARFADWRIGVCSQRAQMWVDRHFALDYTLKSLEKILDGAPRHSVRGARIVLKGAAFRVLAGMLDLLGTADPGSPDPSLGTAVLALLEREACALAIELVPALEQLLPSLPATSRQTLEHEVTRWRSAEDWRLINANDPCGT